MRTGERTPVGVRMEDPPASIPKHWMFCHTARNLRAAVASVSPVVPGVVDREAPQQESVQTVRVVERSDGTATPGEWYVPLHLLRLRASNALVQSSGGVDGCREAGECICSVMIACDHKNPCSRKMPLAPFSLTDNIQLWARTTAAVYQQVSFPRALLSVFIPKRPDQHAD